MKKLHLSEEWFHGAVSLERKGEAVKPWRIPIQDYELFPPNGLNGTAQITAGIRLRFRTDSEIIELKLEAAPAAAVLDLTVDGQLFGRADILADEATSARWSGLPSGYKDIEIWLPQGIGVTIGGLYIDEHAAAEVVVDSRPKWITYGSSITQCAAAESPTLTWPAIVSKSMDYNLTCLGYSGQCMIEPMVGRMIRDLPADFITLCLGINVYGAGSLNARTFKPAVIGLLQIIREKHKVTPIVVISPIFAPDRELELNKAELNLTIMREELKDTVALLQNRGDQHIYYRSGKEWFGEADGHLLPDRLHPNAEGYRLMGERFEERILAGVKL